jgi:hypothetical protein
VRRWERVGSGAARASDFIEARFIDATRVVVIETAAQKAKPTSELPIDRTNKWRQMAEAGSTLLHRTEPSVAAARLL